MKLLEHLREWSASHDEWSGVCETQYKVSDASTLEERVAAGQRMAELLESHADRMERSGLVRWFASSFTPDGLRAEAAEFRAGRNPYAD